MPSRKNLAKALGAVVGWAVLAAPSLAESAVRFLDTEPLTVRPGESTTATVTVTPAGPAQVAIVAADGEPTAVGVDVQCSAGSATASHVFEAARAEAAATRPALDCPGGSLIGLNVFASQGEGKAVLVISSNSGVATRALTVAKAPPPEVIAPAKLDLQLESLGGVGDDGKVVETRSAFVVPAAPITAIATGPAGEGTVTLRGDKERPSFLVKDLSGYGTFVANFDINGPTADGDLELTLHHHRPGWVALVLLGAGAAVASFIAALQRWRDQTRTRASYIEARERADLAQAGILEACSDKPGLDATTLETHWAWISLITPLSASEKKKADKVQAFADNASAYEACASGAAEIVPLYVYFHEQNSNDTADSIRALLHGGPGADVTAGRTKLVGARRLLMEARHLHEVFEQEISGVTDHARRAQLVAARDSLERLTDVTARAQIDAAWAVLHEPLRVSERSSVVHLVEGMAFAGQQYSGGGPVAVILPGGAPPPMPPEATSRAPSATSLLLGSKAAAVLAFSLGLVAATVLDYAATFGANAGWGTNWDMLATFGRAFSVTGVVQVARVLGATAGGA